MARDKILVVDDEPNARSGLSQLLQQDGYEVDAAADGLEALQRIVEGEPALVVTDLKMPKMDGIALVTAIRQRGLELPVIVVTAFGDTASSAQVLRAGASICLTKPVDFDLLSRAITRLLAARGN